MKHPHLLLYLSLPLILLLAYTGLSKLQDLEGFQQALLKQPLPESLHQPLGWLLPLSEVVAALLLVWKPRRPYGWWLAFGLMTAFTLYVGLILSGAFGYVPCSCGGILERMSWEAHLLLNASAWLLSLLGLHASQGSSTQT